MCHPLERLFLHLLAINCESVEHAFSMQKTVQFLFFDEFRHINGDSGHSE